MDKLNKTKDLLLAASLAASLVALGCTTNQNYGNGTPTRSGPDVRTTPTSGVTTGGETYTPPMPPPMMSSYSPSIRRSPDEAAAIMAQHQATRGRYLGVTNPGPNGGVVDPQSARVVNPSALVNPQLTVNSSISSLPTSVINTGAVATGGTAAVTLPIVASSNVPSVTAVSGGAPVVIMRSTDGSVTVTNVSGQNQ